MLQGVEVPPSAASPPLVLYAALISAGVAVLVLVASNYYNTKREYENWRREELSKAVIEALNQMNKLKEKRKQAYGQYNAGLYMNELSEINYLNHAVNLHAASTTFGQQYTEIVAELITVVTDGGKQSIGDMNGDIDRIQFRFTALARRELRRTTWGPPRKSLALLGLVVLIPLYLVLRVTGLGSSKLSKAITQYRDRHRIEGD